MFALIGVLKKADGMDGAAFRMWWLQEHAAQARQLPGLRRYTVYPVVKGFDPMTGQTTDSPSHDGVAMLWFDNEADLRAAFASSVGKQDREHGLEAPVEYLLFCTDGEMEIPLHGPLPC